MLDLNRIFASQSLVANAFALTPSPAAGPQANSFASPDAFADILSSVQSETTTNQEFQDETWSSAVMMQQFQAASAMRPAATETANSSDGNANDKSYRLSEPAKAQAAAQSKPVTTSPVEREDVYQKNPGQESAMLESDPLSTAATSDDGGDASASKLKHHKESSGHGGNEAALPSAPVATADSRVGSSLVSSTPADLAAGRNTATDAETTPGALRNVSPKASSADKRLAFAVRIQGCSAASASSPSSLDLSNASSDGSSLPESMPQPQSSPFAAQLSAMMGQSASSPALGQASGARAQGGLPSIGSPIAGISTAESTPANETSADASAEEAAPLAEASEPAASAQPVKAVQVQITGADNQRVDLKLIEKAGTLTMSVRSADGTLTKALQQSLPELSNHLNEQQIQAELWKPDATKTDSQQNAATMSDSASHSSSGQDQGSQSGGSPGQQGGRGTPQPDWVEELTDLRKSNQTGAKYSWHL